MRCMALWKQARISSEHHPTAPNSLARAKVEGRRPELKWTLRQCTCNEHFYCLLRETVL